MDSERPEMDKELLEVVLKRSANNAKIKRIIDIKWESGVPKGENYSSTVKRISLKVVLGNGRISNKSFIVKLDNLYGEKSNTKVHTLTKEEATIYTNILREMEHLMEEFGDTEGPLWCEMIYFNQIDGIIILEDLKASGFSNVKRTELQDLEHAKLALRSLGRYHAMAKVLEERGLISKDNFKLFPILYEDFMIKNIIYGGQRALVKGMRATWGEEWAEAADKLSRISLEELSRRIKNNTVFTDATFNCLNHGDCFTNNMMFKHNWEGKPISLRFVDFQIPHYSSPCIDVIYYMYTSIKPEVRRQNYKTLVRLYHDSLISSLDRFGYKESKPSLEEIENTLERLLFFILALFIGNAPAGFYKSADALDLKKLFGTGGEEGFNLNIYAGEDVKEKIGEEIKVFLKMLDSE